MARIVNAKTTLWERVDPVGWDCSAAISSDAPGFDLALATRRSATFNPTS